MCDGADKVTSLEQLLAGIRSFVATPVGAVTLFQLGERLIRMRHGIDLLELCFAGEAAMFADTDEAAVQGSTSPYDWVRHQCRMSGSAAGRSLTTGEEAPNLPESVAALEEGRIGFGHLALLASTERALKATGTFQERPLLDLALEHSVGAFGYDCSHARHAGDAAGVLGEQVNAVESRRLEFSKCEDGRVALHGMLDPVGRDGSGRA